MTPIENLIEEATRRIVADLQPRRIILFGSAAREAAGPESDLDFLIVMPDGTDRLEGTGVAHRALRRLPRIKEALSLPP